MEAQADMKHGEFSFTFPSTGHSKTIKTPVRTAQIPTPTAHSSIFTVTPVARKVAKLRPRKFIMATSPELACLNLETEIAQATTTHTTITTSVKEGKDAERLVLSRLPPGSIRRAAQAGATVEQIRRSVMSGIAALSNTAEREKDWQGGNRTRGGGEREEEERVEKEGKGGKGGKGEGEGEVKVAKVVKKGEEVKVDGAREWKTEESNPEKTGVASAANFQQEYKAHKKVEVEVGEDIKQDREAHDDNQHFKQKKSQEEARYQQEDTQDGIMKLKKIHPEEDVGRKAATTNISIEEITTTCSDSLDSPPLLTPITHDPIHTTSNKLHLDLSVDPAPEEAQKGITMPIEYKTIDTISIATDGKQFAIFETCKSLNGTPSDPPVKPPLNKQHLKAPTTTTTTTTTTTEIAPYKTDPHKELSQEDNKEQDTKDQRNLKEESAEQNAYNRQKMHGLEEDVEKIRKGGNYQEEVNFEEKTRVGKQIQEADIEIKGEERAPNRQPSSQEELPRKDCNYRTRAPTTDPEILIGDPTVAFALTTGVQNNTSFTDLGLEDDTFEPADGEMTSGGAGTEIDDVFFDTEDGFGGAARVEMILLEEVQSNTGALAETKVLQLLPKPMPRSADDARVNGVNTAKFWCDPIKLENINQLQTHWLFRPVTLFAIGLIFLVCFQKIISNEKIEKLRYLPLPPDRFTTRKAAETLLSYNTQLQELFLLISINWIAGYWMRVRKCKIDRVMEFLGGVFTALKWFVARVWWWNMRVIDLIQKIAPIVAELVALVHFAKTIEDPLKDATRGTNYEVMVRVVERFNQGIDIGADWVKGRYLTKEERRTTFEAKAPGNEGWGLVCPAPIRAEQTALIGQEVVEDTVGDGVVAVEEGGTRSLSNPGLILLGFLVWGYGGRRLRRSRARRVRT